MKSIFYYLPPIIVDIIRLIKTFIELIPFIFKKFNNSDLENIKINENVYVIANGPSLNNYDIPSLYGKDVIVMNNFNLAEWKDKVNIIAHCIGEPNKSHSWSKNELDIMEDTNAFSYWFHISNLKEVKEKNKSLNKNCHFVFSSIPAGLWRNKQKINLKYPVLGYQTTAQMAIMVGLFMGYKKIYLIGFDHDWLCQRDISPHFYKERDGVTKAILSNFSYYELIKITKNMWEIYYKIYLSSISMDAKIINLSRPTYLDVFELHD